VEHFAPARLAFPGDPIGLQLGRPEASVTKLLVSLDPTIEALEFGLEHGCDAWLVHHPLFFTPTRSLVEDTPTAKVAARAISAGMAL
ncbi:Nif3-like dinuclear metal center hexameric protein, partial [Acinetobacter baumannii]